MLSLLGNWQGQVIINDIEYKSIQSALKQFQPFDNDIRIKLLPKKKKCLELTDSGSEKLYKIKVKPYMTQKAIPEFDFMAKWNNDNPMPLRVMTGTIEKETRGMVYMKLHGIGEAEIHCLRCGRTLTNPISKKYGIGPECITKLGFICDIEDVDIIKDKLQELTWEGWIIKSAITEQEEVV